MFISYSHWKYACNKAFVFVTAHFSTVKLWRLCTNTLTVITATRFQAYHNKEYHPED